MWEMETSRKLSDLFSLGVNGVEEVMKLSGAANPRTNDVIDVAVPEFYISDRGVKVKNNNDGEKPEIEKPIGSLEVFL